MTNQLPLAGIRLLNEQEAAQVDFGPLTQLQGTWKGQPMQGWNVIAVPGPKDFILEVIPYEETLTFSPAAIAGNRGPFTNGVENTQNVAGFLYQQIITSTCDSALCKERGFPSGTEIHAETGLFLYLENDNEGFNIARLSTIPHGNSLLAMGNGAASATLQNFIPDNSVNPTPNPMFGYDEEQYPSLQFEQFNQQNPNSFLQKVVGAQQVTALTTLDLSTKNSTGGILNIPFIQSNINTTFLDATFWIETLADGSLQLQYSQTINLVFPPTDFPKVMVNWPHVTVNTLQKVN